jgi:hypothetical protein
VIIERLLAISGEDQITVARKFKSAWDGHLPTRFEIFTNDLPSSYRNRGWATCAPLALGAAQSAGV